MKKDPAEPSVPSLYEDDDDPYAAEQTLIVGYEEAGRMRDPRAELRPCLVVIGGEMVGAVFDIPENGVVLGRGPQATIRIRDWGVSRLHARLDRTGEGNVEIADLQSVNGTFVNTYRVAVPRRLREGDRIRIGRTTLRFTLTDEVELSGNRFPVEALSSGRMRVLAEDGKALKIACAVYRGGTSRALFFLEADLPRDPDERDRIVLAAFGSPDSRQIDGLGGADPLTSKVGYIGPPSVGGADLDYTFGYVGITQPVIDYAGSCGNTAAAVGPFALLRGLIRATDPTTRVRIHNTNTGKIIVAEFPTRRGEFISEGPLRIDGVPGTGSTIRLDFVGSGGSVTGRLLPTGKPREEVDFPGVGRLMVSFVDAANPFVFVRGADLGLKGDETIEDVSSNVRLLHDCEIIRCVAAEILGIARSSDATNVSPGVPKVALISPPVSYLTTNGRREGDPTPRHVEASEIDVIARMTALQKLHKTFAVTGAVCVGAAAKIEGTIVNEIFSRARPNDPTTVRIGHPSGTIAVEMDVKGRGEGIELTTATLLRTARLLMDGYVYVPAPP